MLSKQIDFFLVGAPKCGTTAIYDALSQHPEIYLPEEKELHFFSPDFYPDDYITWEQYDAQFNHFSHELMMGESSVWYLYSREAPKLIHHYNPDARIIICLRNPPEMVQSLHSQNVFDNTECFEELTQAIAHEVDRKRGENIPEAVYNPRTLFYSELADYYEFVKIYFEKFGSNQVMVILHDDFKEDPLQVMRRLHEFLDVSVHFTPEIHQVNARKHYRSRVLRSLVNPPFHIKNLGRKLLPFTWRRKIIKTVNSLNTVPDTQVVDNPVPQELLSERHRMNIIRLGELIDRDLSMWLS